MRFQGLRISLPAHADDETEAAGAPSLHTRKRVLNDHDPGRLGAKPPGGHEKGVRRGLAAQAERLLIVSVDADVEEIGNAGGMQDRRAVPAGGDDCDPDAGPPQPSDQLHRIRVCLNTAVVKNLEKESVLSSAQPLDRVLIRTVIRTALRKHDASGAEKSPDAVTARTAINVPAVVVRTERNIGTLIELCTLFKKAVEDLLPSGLVHKSGVRHHAVEIERNAIKAFGCDLCPTMAVWSN